MIASIEPQWPAEEVVVGDNERGLGEEAAARATSAHGQELGVQPETIRRRFEQRNMNMLPSSVQLLDILQPKKALFFELTSSYNIR